MSKTVYKGTDTKGTVTTTDDQEVYVYIDTANYRLVRITNGATLCSGLTSCDTQYSNLYYSRKEYQTTSRVKVLLWYITYTYNYVENRVVLDTANSEIYKTYFRKTKDGTIINVPIINEDYIWNLSGNTSNLSIYTISLTDGYLFSGEISNNGEGNNSYSSSSYIPSEKTDNVALDNMGSIIGTNSGDYSFSKVYATTYLVLGEYRYNIPSVSNNNEEYSTSANALTISKKNITEFDNNIDTITTNEMFINAGWSSQLWTKDNDRIFPI